MKPILFYDKYWKIKFLKISKGSMLIFEWLEENQPNYKHPLNFKIRSINGDEGFDVYFEITLVSWSADCAKQLFKYLKENM